MCGTIEWRRRDSGKAGEIAKIELSTSTTSHITLPFLAAGPSGPIHFDYVLTRAELERIVRPFASIGEAPESTRATLLHFSACEPLPAIRAMFRSSSKT